MSNPNVLWDSIPWVDNVFEAVKSETQIDLKNLKENIEASKIKKILELVEANKDELKKGDISSIMSSIIWSLNHKSMEIRVVWEKEIDIYSGWKENWSDMKLVINDFLQRWIISISNIQNALLYKTTSIDDFITLHSDPDNIKEKDYVIYLLKKYNIKWKSVVDIKIEDSDEQIKKDIQSISEADYKSMIETIKYHVRWENISDREYIINYFQSFRKWVAVEKDPIKEYRDWVSENERKLLKGLNDVPENVLTDLWIRSNEAKDIWRKFKKDPLWFVAETLNKWWWTGLILWIIWFFMWWWKWFLVWFLWWTAVWAYGWDMISYANAWEIQNDISNVTNNAWNFISSLPWNMHELYYRLNIDFPSNLDKTKFNDSFKALSVSSSFKNLSIDQLIEAKNNQNWNSLAWLFGDISVIWGISWETFYSENKKEVNYIINKLFEAREEEDTKVWDLFIKTNSYTETAAATASAADTAADETVSSWTWTAEQDSNSTEIIASMSVYFWIDKKYLTELQKTLEEWGLNLNIITFLSSYKNYIDTNLGWLEGYYLKKIKKSIWFRVKSIWSIIEELKEKETEKYWNLDNFKNNRWIINEKIWEHLSFINSELLPSLEAYVKLKWWTQLDKKFYTSKYNARHRSMNSDYVNPDYHTWEIKQLLEAELDKEWNFDEWFFSTQDLFDINNPKHAKMLRSLWINSQEVNLLSEKDVEIEEDIELIVLWLLAIEVIPQFIPWINVAFILASIWISVHDTFDNEDLFIKIARKVPWIFNWEWYEDYRTEDTILDNVISSIWIIPIAWWIAKWTKLMDKLEKLNPEKLQKLFDYMDKMAESTIWDETVIWEIKRYILKNIWKRKEKSLLDEKSEAAKIEEMRASNYGRLNWDYEKYDQRYQDLYNNLDSRWINDLKARWVEIEKLDRKIAKEIIKEKKSKIDRKYKRVDSIRYTRLAKQKKHLEKLVDSKIPGFNKMKNDGDKIDYAWVEIKLISKEYGLYEVNGKKNIKKADIFKNIPKSNLKQEAVKVFTDKMNTKLSKVDFKTHDWKTYKAQADWTWVDISDKSNPKVLTDAEKTSLIDKNIDVFYKQMNWFSVAEVLSKSKKSVVDLLSYKWIKTVWDFMKSSWNYVWNAWYINWTKSKFFSIDGIASIPLTPATTIKQLVDSIILDRNFKDTFKILLLLNKHKSLTNYKDYWRVLWVWSLVFIDNFVSVEGLVNPQKDSVNPYGDKDTSTVDEIQDALSYMYGGIFNTILLKTLWVID